ncbi:MAG: hypothetical protein U5L00_00515 [Desulfovermiculus sp.]|nr:hypothetical protein [Desulfovermiculus sp.]
MSEQIQKVKQIGLGFAAGAIVLLIVILPPDGWSQVRQHKNKLKKKPKKQ